MIERTLDAFTQHPLVFIYIVSCFTVMCLLWFDLFQYKNNQLSRQVSMRIGEEPERDGLMFVNFFLRFFSRQETKIKKELDEANVLFEVKEYLTTMSVGAIIGLLVGLILFPLSVVFKGIFAFLPILVLQDFLGRLLAGFSFAFLGSLTPKLLLKWKIVARKKELREQIQEALNNMADALDAGHMITDVMRIVGYDMPYPIGDEFERVYDEMEAGKTFLVALNEMKERVNIPDFTMAVNAIEIQYEVGGRLSPLLRNMAKIIQDRNELKKEIEKAISSSKMVGVVLLVAPIFFAIVFTMLNAEQYATLITTFIGQVLVAVATVCYIIAAVIIWMIIKNVSKDI